MKRKLNACETPVRQVYLGGEGSTFLSKRKRGGLAWQAKVHLRCHPSEKEELRWFAHEMGILFRGYPYSLTEIMEIVGYFAEQKRLHLLAELEVLFQSSSVSETRH